jgi:hypothetical protein|tara:strand:+ start:811 stop:1014 length:204 start_codon:yes stop_codon:yes gene_type:complete
MNNGLSWTILRPLMLISKPGTGQYTVWLGMKPPHRVKWKIAHADVSTEALHCIETIDHGNQGMQISW